MLSHLPGLLYLFTLSRGKTTEYVCFIVLRACALFWFRTPAIRRLVRREVALSSQPPTPSAFAEDAKVFYIVFLPPGITTRPSTPVLLSLNACCTAAVVSLFEIYFVRDDRLWSLDMALRPPPPRLIALPF